MEVTLTEAKAKLSAMVEKALAGEEVVLTRMGKPAVKLVPCESTTHTRRIGFAKGYFEEQPGAWDEWPEDIARALHITG
jgi:prevent-host-death family protein